MIKGEGSQTKLVIFFDQMGIIASLRKKEMRYFLQLFFVKWKFTNICTYVYTFIIDAFLCTISRGKKKKKKKCSKKEGCVYGAYVYINIQ